MERRGRGRRVITGAAAAVLGGSLAGAADLPRPPFATALTALEGRLEAERLTRNLPSLSVAVVRGNEIVLRRAFGHADLERRTPATPEHVYRAGSITKVFVATALLQLVERGAMRLDDPLAKYVPEYRPSSRWPDTPPTTLRQLASHTSGLPRDAAVNFWMNHSIGAWPFSRGQAPIRWYASKERLLETLPTVELERPPDTEPLYSNLGMSLLAIAIERASGQAFPDYVSEHVLAPLGMVDSGLVLEEARARRVATGYVYTAPADPPLVAPPWELGAALYTGGLAATPTDLARFLAAQFPTPDGRRSAILSQDSLRQMRTSIGRSDACLGWWTTELDGRPLIGHTGGHFGFLASIGALPDLGLGIALMTNSWNPVLGANDTWELTKVALADLARAVAPETTASAVPFDPARVDLARYAGSYSLPGGFAHVDVTLREGRLWQAVREAPGPATRCEPTGPHRFSCGLEFRVDGEGRVRGLSFALFEFSRVP